MEDETEKASVENIDEPKNDQVYVNEADNSLQEVDNKESGESEQETEEQPVSENNIEVTVPEVAVDKMQPEQTKVKRPFLKRIFRLPKTKKGKIIAVITLLLVVAGMYGGFVILKTDKNTVEESVTLFRAKPVPFVVVSSSPANDQEGVSPNGVVTLRFSRPVNPDDANGDFFFTPEIEGTYSQGADENEIVFTPKKPFENPAIINFMIHGEFTSSDGSVLGADYYLNFTTAIPDDRVVFENMHYYSSLTSSPSGQKETFTIRAGAEAIAKSEINLYKADAKAFLSSYTYTNEHYDDSSYTYKSRIDSTVNTETMVLLDTKKDYKDSDTFDVQQSSGIYFLEAKSNGRQVGNTWIVYGDNGVIVRQDDQKLIAVAKNTKTGADMTSDITMYNLQNSVVSIKSGDIKGIAEFTIPYSTEVDCVVAHVGGEELIIPINMIDSFADIRMRRDLSEALTTFASSDRPVYVPGDTAKIAGFTRVDNDAHYLLPDAQSMGLSVIVGGNEVSKVTAQVDGNGLVSASIPIIKSMLSADELNTSVDVQNVAEGITIASFTVQNPDKRVKAFTISASFDKQDYTAVEKPKMTIVAKKSDGSAYGDQTASVAWYEKDYVENSIAYNESLQSTLGSALSYDNNGEPETVTVKLDASGYGTVDLPISKLSGGSSRSVSALVTIKGSAGTVKTTASTIVHQGDYYITLLPSKEVFATNEDLIVRAVVRDLQGQIVQGVQVRASFIVSTYNETTQENVDKEVASVTGVADVNGRVELKKMPSGLSINDNLSVVVSVADTKKNKISKTKYLYVKDPESHTSPSHLQLSNLDVSGISDSVSVGDTIQTTVNAPYDINALVTYERGRVLHSESLSLKKGANQYSLAVTEDLATGFTLVFSYFIDGAYANEGVVIPVKNPAKSAVVNISTDKSQYSVGTNASVTINTISASTSAVSRLIVKVVDENIFTINNSIGSDMYSFFHGEREITTNGSSSRTSAGSGGGHCGGGFWDVSSAVNELGSTIFYATDLVTDKDGKATLNIPLKKAGDWRIIVQSATDDTVVGSGYATVSVK